VRRVLTLYYFPLPSHILPFLEGGREGRRKGGRRSENPEIEVFFSA